MKNTLHTVAAAFAALALAGCTSFHVTQSVKFVDDDGRFVSVVYGYGDRTTSRRSRLP